MSLHTRLFVGNIPDHLTDCDLRKSFSTYGDIVNLELKNKLEGENDKKRFAFITLSASNYYIESCIKDFANQGSEGQRLYVTRARESFLERLQREREQAKQLEENKKRKSDHVPEHKPLINLGHNLNPPKRNINTSYHTNENGQQKLTFHNVEIIKTEPQQHSKVFSESSDNSVGNLKKLNSEQKRLESLKRKRKEFKDKKMIIKTGLIGIDKVPNKKVIFSDTEENCNSPSLLKNNPGKKIINNEINEKISLFDEEDSDNEVNFEIKKQFEGEKGQKVLDLQSRYKSDKRFKLDERFIEESSVINEKEDENINDGESIDIGQSDEKSKQMTILQDVLGVSLKMSNSDSIDRKKSKLGMLRYDPMHPDHAKFLVPVENLSATPKKGNKKKSKDVIDKPIEPELVVEKVEASKEQFYKVSETLKEAMAQPNTFSLRNLFNNDDKEQEQSPEYVELSKQKEKKPRNQLDISGKNPFVYDSSDTEDEDKEKTLGSKQTNDDAKLLPENSEPKAVWRENLFFSPNDHRLREGLLFFNKFEESERQKERRGLKTVMKKRIYNKERKNHMFQKKIGGRKKTMKKSIPKRR